MESSQPKGSIAKSRRTPRNKGIEHAFFTMDRRTWHLVCDLGDVNLAATYMTIAQGVYFQHSKWSAKSVWIYTGISRPRAAEHIEHLVKKGFLRLGPLHTRAKPQYAVTSYEGLSQPDTGVPYLEKKASDTLWLPTVLVQGLKDKAAPPIRELVATQNICPLRCLTDLYAEQHLAGDGGISRRVVYDRYRKDQIGERGEVVVWSFVRDETRRGTDERWMDAYDDDSFFDAIKTLYLLGLLGVVEHLTQSESSNSEITHAIPNHYCEGALPDEARVARAAQAAALSLLTPALQQKVEYRALLVPVKRHLPKVHCFGIYRLTHRPHTALTEEWALRSREAAETYVPLYEQWKLKGDRAAQNALENHQKTA